MIYVTIVFRSITGKWMTETKEFSDKVKALRFMYSVRSKGHIIDHYKCDDPEDTEYLSRRIKLC